MSKLKSSILVDILIYFFVLIIVIVNCMYKSSLNYWVLFTFIFNSILCLFIMNYFDKTSISLNKMFMIFNLFFLIIAPSYQYGKEISFWKAKVFSDAMYIKANVIILFFLLLYLAFSFRYLKNLENKKVDLYFELSTNTKVFLLFCSYLILIYFIYKYGFNNLINGNMDNSTVTIGSIIVIGIRFIPVVISFLFVCNAKHNKHIDIYAFLSFVSVLIVVFPLGGAPRNYVAATYIFLLYPLYANVKYKNFLLGIMTFGLLVVFPSINIFRHNDFNLSNINVSVGIFDTADYDSYQMLLYGMKYVEVEGIEFGRQLLGSVLFFIPRSIWNNKPLHTGQFLGEYFYTIGSNNELFTNLSAPILCEFFIDFGYLGVVICPFLISWVFKVISKRGESSNYSVVIYAILFSFVIYISRGALLATLPKFFGCCLATFIVYFIVYILDYKRIVDNKYDSIAL